MSVGMHWRDFAMGGEGYNEVFQVQKSEVNFLLVDF